MFLNVLQEKVALAGAEWSHCFQFHKTSTFREDFKNPVDSPYISGAAHFSKWWMVGHPVSTTFISLHFQPNAYYPPDFSADMYTPENMIAWNDLFTELELVFHASNMVLE